MVVRRRVRQLADGLRRPVGARMPTPRRTCLGSTRVQRSRRTGNEKQREPNLDAARVAARLVWKAHPYQSDLQCYLAAVCAFAGSGSSMRDQWASRFSGVDDELRGVHSSSSRTVRSVFSPARTSKPAITPSGAWVTCSPSPRATRPRRRFTRRQGLRWLAFDAGNLSPVALARSVQVPACALGRGDDDRLTVGNPGRTQAEAAARAVGGVATFPPFASLDHRSDWNDFAAIFGPIATLKGVLVVMVESSSVA